MTEVADCPICQKHAGDGPLRGELVGRTPLFWVWHAPPEDSGKTRLGHLIVESHRHVPYMLDLNPEEAAELGQLRTRLARGLKQDLDVEFVLAAVIGMGVDHFHEHLYARPHREPDDVEWSHSDELLELVDDDEVRALAVKLRPMVDGTGLPKLN